MSFLNLTAFFIERDGGLLEHVTLGTVPFREKGTSKNIGDAIKAHLQQFDLTINDIFGLTSDSENTMKKLWQVLNEAPAESSTSPSETPRHTVLAHGCLSHLRKCLLSSTLSLSLSSSNASYASLL